jgi:hypothetical protein
MPKPSRLTEKQVETAIGLSRTVGRLALLHKAKVAIQRRLTRLERQIAALETAISTTASIQPEQLNSLLSQYSGGQMDAAAALSRQEKAKQRHTPDEKRAFLLESLRRHQKLHPSDQTVRLEWIRKEFEERFTLRPITNTTIYFAGIIKKTWYSPRTNTRNRSIEMQKAMQGLSVRT